jgi:hypothetical protein
MQQDPGYAQHDRGAEENPEKGRPPMLDVLFTLTEASLVSDSHYTWTVEK